MLVIKRIRGCLLGIGLTGCIAFTLQAQETLTVGVFEDLRPYMWKEANGEVQGTDIAIIREVGKRIGHPIQFQALPAKRSLISVEEGSLDFCSSFLFEERKKWGLYAEEVPLHWSSYRIFVKKGKEFPFRKMSDLYGLKIGKNRGLTVNDEFMQAATEKKIQIHESSTFEAMVSMLNAEHLNGVVANANTAQTAIYAMGLQDTIVPLAHPLTESKPVYLLLSKASPGPDKARLIERINKTLIQMKKEGFMKGLEATYPGFKYTP